MSARAAGINQTAVPLTPESHRHLRELLDQLRTTERAEVSARVHEARATADNPAENDELMYALQAQMQLERRIAELESRLAHAQVVDGTGGERQAAIGTRVRLRRLTPGAGTVEYELVSSIEADPARGRLSVESPVGEALLGRKPGETVEVATPRGAMAFEVVAVSVTPAGRLAA